MAARAGLQHKQGECDSRRLSPEFHCQAGSLQAFTPSFSASAVTGKLTQSSFGLDGSYNSEKLNQ